MIKRRFSFVEIMNLPVLSIAMRVGYFQNKTQDLIDKLQLDPNSYFELIELGEF
jgi:hypothetical protein